MFDNEGEVTWNHQIFSRRIESNENLLEKLYDTGYSKNQKYFTAEQVSLIFKHLSHPILNQKNKDLLKIKDEIPSFLRYMSDNKTLPDISTLKKMDDFTRRDFEILGIIDIKNNTARLSFNSDYIINLSMPPLIEIIDKKTLRNWEIYTTKSLMLRLYEIYKETLK
jgi:tRNA(Ser,Leu) C12 N-acetylase TAN1